MTLHSTNTAATIPAGDVPPHGGTSPRGDTVAEADGLPRHCCPRDGHAKGTLSAKEAVKQYCQTHEGRRPDPRTTLVVVLVVNVLSLSRSNMLISLIAMAVTLVALLIARAQRMAALYFGMQAFWMFLIFVPSALYPCKLTAFFMLFGFWMFKLFGIVGIALYALHVLVPSDLVAALRHIHAPIAITVPLTVMLRFIPLVCKEYRAVREAMALRGLSMGWRAMLHPLQYLEFILVPLLSSCVRIADEMTAAGMVRGLGSKIRPTTITRLRFSLTDFAWIVVLILMTASLPLLQDITIVPGGFQ